MEANNMRYTQPTFSSAVDLSDQHEVEVVSNSFKTGSFCSLNKLPSTIRPGQIRADRMKAIIHSKFEMSEKSFRPPHQEEFFSKIKHISSDYGKSEQIKNAENELKRLNMQSFSRKAFSYPTSRAKMKYEDIFEDKTFRYPLLGPSAETSILPALKTEGCIGGPFRIKKSLSPGVLVERDRVQEWCMSIHKVLSEDWPQLRFSIKYTQDEEILLEFDIALIESSLIPLKRYVACMVASGVGAEHRLRRRGDRWAVEEEGRLVFSLLVPWVAAGALQQAARRETIKLLSSKSKSRKSPTHPDNRVDSSLPNPHHPSPAGKVDRAKGPPSDEIARQSSQGDEMCRQTSQDDEDLSRKLSAGSDGSSASDVSVFLHSHRNNMSQRRFDL